MKTEKSVLPSWLIDGLRSDVAPQIPLRDASDHADDVHVFDHKTLRAVQASLLSGRPLLVQGEPGTGKTQLAWAIAKAFKWAIVSHTVTSHSEAQELQFTFDAVKRLAEAQIAGALAQGKVGEEARADLESRIQPEKFIAPGPLWWAFHWQRAQIQAGHLKMAPPDQPQNCDWEKGCVLLIDEIDKADRDVPNGLLDALGHKRFHVPGIEKPVKRQHDNLLILITTNNEQALPDAFMRRCAVLHLDFGEGDELKENLLKIANAHFPTLEPGMKSDAAELVLKDRQQGRNTSGYASGPAEYLDLLRVLHEIPADERQGGIDLIQTFSPCFFNKNQDEPQS